MTATRRARHAAARWVAVVLLTASCSGGGGSPTGPPLYVGAPVVEVTMREFTFEHTDRIPAGPVVFRVQNAGTVPHRITMIRLPEDLPPLDVQLNGTERRPITPFAGTYDRLPGRDGTFAVDLAPGQRYGMVCFIVDEDGSHAVRGMSSEFRAGGPPPKPNP